MRRLIPIGLVLIALSTELVWAGITCNKLRYRGGTIQARTSPYDWNATLTVDDDLLVLVVAPKHTIRLKPSQVVSLSSGSAARFKVSEVAAKSLPAAPPGLFGLMKKSSDYLIGIVYQTEDGKQGAVLLECQAANYWPLLRILGFVTGKRWD